MTTWVTPIKEKTGIEGIGRGGDYAERGLERTLCSMYYIYDRISNKLESEHSGTSYSYRKLRRPWMCIPLPRTCIRTKIFYSSKFPGYM